MVKKARKLAELTGTVDVACVIHGQNYQWEYVDNLYAMVVKNTMRPVRFHVFTEHDRSVPGHMVKHILQEWPDISGPKKSWWYKMQVFDPKHIQGRVLYLDLDLIIVRNIDWLWNLDSKYFWGIKDFRYIWKPNWQGINSSIMLWDVVRYSWIWTDFAAKNIHATVKQYHGDQDYLNAALDKKNLRFFDTDLVKSWRWQILDGGLHPSTKTYKTPGSGTKIDPSTSVVVFHGHPKPHQLTDTDLRDCWQQQTRQPSYDGTLP